MKRSIGQAKNPIESLSRRVSQIEHKYYDLKTM
jgi:hypothetical protein